MGGSAGCSTFIPQVVQCYNRGSDGVDVQVSHSLFILSVFQDVVTTLPLNSSSLLVSFSGFIRVVQWECKCDMDNAYRLGNIEVACEGYDHPDDPFILKGSCGVRKRYCRVLFVLIILYRHKMLLRIN